MVIKKAYESVEIIQNIKVSDDVYKMVVKGNFNAKVGQFYMVKCFEDRSMLPRPISICDIEGDTMVLLYQVVGKGTDIMAKRSVGEKIQVLGPLGNGFNIEEIKESDRIAIVGGGIGIAPLLYLAKSIKGKIDLYLGFRENAYFLDEFKPFVDNIYVATNNGSYGHKGYVTELIKDEKYKAFYCCGPLPMMLAVKALNLDAKVYLSLESRMACGVGACLACSHKTNKGMKRVCKEGPVFEAREVSF